MSGTVRFAAPSDADAVARTYVDASMAALASAGRKDAIEAAAAGAHPLWRPMRRPAAGQWMLVHEAEAEAAGAFGFASFGEAGERVGHLYALYVTPMAWSTGIGSRLHDAALGLMAEAGITSVELWVQPVNERALRFYEARGWRTAADERTNERGTFVRMARQL